MAEIPRCGDHVLHGPTGETWVVAWCEGDDLAWCGWPNGQARTADCTLVYRASETEHRALVRKVAGVDDSRGPRCARLYADALEAKHMTERPSTYATYENARRAFAAACRDPDISKAAYDRLRQAEIDAREAWLRVTFLRAS